MRSQQVPLLPSDDERDVSPGARRPLLGDSPREPGRRGNFASAEHRRPEWPERRAPNPRTQHPSRGMRNRPQEPNDGEVSAAYSPDSTRAHAAHPRGPRSAQRDRPSDPPSKQSAYQEAAIGLPVDPHLRNATSAKATAKPEKPRDEEEPKKPADGTPELMEEGVWPDRRERPSSPTPSASSDEPIRPHDNSGADAAEPHVNQNLLPQAKGPLTNKQQKSEANAHGIIIFLGLAVLLLYGGGTLFYELAM